MTNVPSIHWKIYSFDDIFALLIQMTCLFHQLVIGSLIVFDATEIYLNFDLGGWRRKILILSATEKGTIGKAILMTEAEIVRSSLVSFSHVFCCVVRLFDRVRYCVDQGESSEFEHNCVKGGIKMDCWYLTQMYAQAIICVTQN